jgi:hypothetical protein
MALNTVGDEAAHLGKIKLTPEETLAFVFQLMKPVIV